MGSESKPSVITFNAKRADLVEMVAVYVRVHAEQSADDRAHRLSKISGEWHA